jgi:hypothetical protein
MNEKLKTYYALALSFVLGAVGLAWAFLRGLLVPPRKSEAREVAERMKETVREAHEQRVKEVEQKLEQIRAEREEQKAADPVELGNELLADIVKR